MPENENCSVKNTDPTPENRLERLKKLVSDDPQLQNLQNIDDAYLERFLNSTQQDVEKAYEKVKLFYELLFDHPDWFRADSPLKKKEIIETEIRVAIPATDKEGRPIYIAKMKNINVDKMDLFDIVSVDDIWLEHIFSQPSRPKGLCAIIDIANYPWKLIKWMTPNNVKIGVKKMQTLPIGDYRIHVVNSSMLIHATIKIIWPFLPAHMKEVIIFHFDNRESLYKYIDPEVLPPEYGGKNIQIDYREQFETLFERNDVIEENLRNQRSLNLTQTVSL